jgi:SAM-dependent methyltransferase
VLSQILNEVRDKTEYKTTTTEKLKLEIYEQCSLETYRWVLELGCDTGNTTAVMALAMQENGGKVLAVDNDSDRIEKAMLLMDKLGLRDSVTFKTMDIYKPEAWDIISKYPIEFAFVDAMHDGDYPLWDIQNIRKHFPRIPVVMHDYGLVGSGVKKAIEKSGQIIRRKMGEERNWNPLKNNTNDWEAVLL